MESEACFCQIWRMAGVKICSYLAVTSWLIYSNKLKSYIPPFLLLFYLDGRCQCIEQKHQWLFGSTWKKLTGVFHNVNLVRSDKLGAQVLTVVVKSTESRDFDGNTAGLGLKSLNSNWNVLAGHLGRQDLGKFRGKDKSTTLQEGEV